MPGRGRLVGVTVEFLHPEHGDGPGDETPAEVGGRRHPARRHLPSIAVAFFWSAAAALCVAAPFWAVYLPTSAQSVTFGIAFDGMDGWGRLIPARIRDSDGSSDFATYHGPRLGGPLAAAAVLLALAAVVLVVIAGRRPDRPPGAATRARLRLALTAAGLLASGIVGTVAVIGCSTATASRDSTSAQLASIEERGGPLPETAVRIGAFWWLTTVAAVCAASGTVASLIRPLAAPAEVVPPWEPTSADEPEDDLLVVTESEAPGVSGDEELLR